MTVIPLSVLDLSIAAILVIVLAALTWWMRTGQARSLLIAAARTVVQLTLLGFVLETIFATNRLSWVLLLMLAMGRSQAMK